MSTESFVIRRASRADRAGVLALVPRLRDFGAPALRSAADLDAGEHRTLERFFEAPPEGARLWVAQSPEAGVIGTAYAERGVDYFTQEHHGHLGILAVSAAAEGQGVGRALLGEVERWGRAEGYRFVTLNVFVSNRRARAVYERAGYVAEAVRYVKAL